MAKFKRNCSDPDMSSIRDVIDRFGDRWSILVLCVLAEDYETPARPQAQASRDARG